MRPREPEIDAFLPLKPRVFALLMILREGAAHGYGLLQGLEARSPTLRMDPGLMYRTIARLSAQALIRRCSATPPGSDPRRKYYELTPLGAAVVSAEVRRQAALLHALSDRTARL